MGEVEVLVDERILVGSKVLEGWRSHEGHVELLTRWKNHQVGPYQGESVPWCEKWEPAC